MSEQRAHRPGDIILDLFVPRLSPEDREIARARLQRWARWKLTIAMDQVRAEMQRADSQDEASGGTIESAPLPPR